MQSGLRICDHFFFCYSCVTTENRQLSGKKKILCEKVINLTAFGLVEYEAEMQSMLLLIAAGFYKV